MKCVLLENTPFSTTMKLLVVLNTCLLLLSIAGTSTWAQVTTAWRMAGFDSTGKGSSAYVSIAQNNAIMYQLDPQSPQQQAPVPASSSAYPVLERPGVVVDPLDTAYFPLGNVYTAVLFNGTIAWNFSCPSNANSAYTTPALTAQFTSIVVVCSGSTKSQVYLLSSSEGMVMWSYAIAAEVTASPVIDDTTSPSQVFIAALDGSIHALLLANGAQSWKSPAQTLNNDPIQGTPCLDSMLLYAFTVGGFMYAFNPLTGESAWNLDVTNGALGFSSLCAVQTTSMGTIGTLVGAGAWDFNLHVISVSDLSGSPYCHYATDNVITQGVSSINGTFLVASSDNTVTAVYPGITENSCENVFQLNDMYSPSRVVIDGHLNALVGTNTGMYLISTKWDSLARNVWAFDVTGQAFNTPSIGPNGNIFVSSTQCNLFAIGVTSGYIQQHTQVAAMIATASLGDVTALANLEFLCNFIPESLQEPYVVFSSVNNLTSVINQTCLMYSFVLAGQDPFGGPPNFVNFQQPKVYTTYLQTDLRQVLVDIDSTIANFTSENSNVQAQLALMNNVLDNYQSTLVQLETAAEQTQSILKSITTTITTIEQRIKILTFMAQSMFTEFISSWADDAANFLAMALADDIMGVAEYRAALGFFGAASHAVKNIFNMGAVKEDIQRGMSDLKASISYMLKSAFWAAEAAEYLEAWVSLIAIEQFFDELLVINTNLMHNNMTFSQALPNIIQAGIDIDSVSEWLQYALNAMKTAPGGFKLSTVLNEYIADSEALYNSDFAFYATLNQYQSQLSQILSLNIQMQETRNAIAELSTPQAGIGSALQVAIGQQYAAQIQVLQTARQACEQYLFWTLDACPTSMAMPSYPSTTDIDNFVSKFDAMVINAANKNVTGNVWAQITFNRTSNPEAFTNASQGIFYLQVYMPANNTFYNVRTTDYRAYFLPFGIEVGQSINIQFSHGGLSQFRDNNNNNYSFTHDPFVDSTPIYYTNTNACQESEHVCVAPQCTNSFNLSPYGLWTLQVNPKAFNSTDDIQEVRLLFELWYQIQGEPPTDFIIFGGGNGEQQLPADYCQSNPLSSL